MVWCLLLVLLVGCAADGGQSSGQEDNDGQRQSEDAGQGDAPDVDEPDLPLEEDAPEDGDVVEPPPDPDAGPGRQCATPIDCEDFNPCTDDGCEDGFCVNAPNDAACDDGFYCNGADTCSQGRCEVHEGSPCVQGLACDEGQQQCVACLEDGDCDDANPCTDESCQQGACIRNDNTNACDDGIFCNGDDTCQGGTCQVHAGSPCSGDTSCVEDELRCVSCLNSADCDDSNPCTDDACVEGTCSNEPNEAACDDGIFCNGDDTCQGGACRQHAGVPCAQGLACVEESRRCVACQGNAECNDFNPCTDDACVDGGCVNEPNNAACDDGLFCNGDDTCSGGSCQTHQGDPCQDAEICVEGQGRCVDCVSADDCQDDGNVCTDMVCQDGQCVAANNNAACDDGLFCNGADSCFGGSCQAHQGDPCGNEFCSEEQGACVECLADRDCPLDLIGEWGRCGGFDTECDETGFQSRTVTQFSCVSGSCVGSSASQVQSCERDTEGQSCRGGTCISGECNPPRTVTIMTSGARNSAARMRVTCVETGESCTVEGSGRSCAVSCPQQASASICCSDGSSPCGGTPASENPSVFIDNVMASGFANNECRFFLHSTLTGQCTAEIGTSNVLSECEFSNGFVE